MTYALQVVMKDLKIFKEPLLVDHVALTRLGWFLWNEPKHGSLVNFSLRNTAAWSAALIKFSGRHTEQIWSQPLLVTLFRMPNSSLHRRKFNWSQNVVKAIGDYYGETLMSLPFLHVIVNKHTKCFVLTIFLVCLYDEQSWKI